MKHLTGIALALALAFAPAVRAAEGDGSRIPALQSPVVEGRHYTLINPPLPTDPKAKIEVLEFFWYGCPHCYDFEPILAKWKMTLAKDVVFRRVPALFPGGRWTTGARIYYALEAMNLVDRLHIEVFDAIHLERVRLDDEKVLFEWLGKKGVDTAKFGEIYRSFAVEGLIKRSEQLSVASGITGVPAVVVQGRYLPASGAAGSYEDITVIIDKLIAKARTELEPAAAPAKPARKK